MRRQQLFLSILSAAALILGVGMSCNIPITPGGVITNGNTSSGGGTTGNTNNNNNGNVNDNSNDNTNDNGGEACSSDPDCDDGMFCNGAEQCVDNACEPGEPPCTLIENCVEQTQVCLEVVCMTDDDCPSGQVCDEPTGNCLDISAGMCGPDAGLCLIENPTPGCESTECCELVCTFQPACCLAPWDESCVSAAFRFCGTVLNR